MAVVYKYPLKIVEQQTINLPEFAQIIRCECVDGLPYLWALVQPDAPSRTRFIEMYKTGQRIETPPRELYYLGACKIIVDMEICLYTFENTVKYNQNAIRTSPSEPWNTEREG